jgi:hypothetical protein
MRATRALAYGTIVAIPMCMLVLGVLIGYYGHPYEACSRMNVGEDNMGECIWLKMHGAN